MKTEELASVATLKVGMCELCHQDLKYVEGSAMALSLPPKYLNRCENCGRNHWIEYRSPAQYARTLV
jgi:hypothetical protein